MGKRLLMMMSLAVIVLLLGTSCTQKTSTGTEEHSGRLEGTISISGAFALYPMTVKWAEEFMKVHPDVRVDISAGGAGKGMTDVLSGMVDLAMFSRDVTQAEVDKGAWYLAVTKDAVVPTINEKNPVLDQLLKKGATRELFQEIFLKEDHYVWGAFTGGDEGFPVNVYTRSDACGAAEMWGKFLGHNQESLNGIGVFGDPGMADAVKNDIYGLGYNNVNYAFDMNTRHEYPGIRVLPLDRNGDGTIGADEDFYESLDSVMNAIQTGRYPSPPARELFLVSKGKPTDPVVIRFMEWILKDGQQFVPEAGYVVLSQEKISSEIQKLK